MLSVVMLSVVMLIVIMLSVIRLSVIRLSVARLTVAAPLISTKQLLSLSGSNAIKLSGISECVPLREPVLPYSNN